MKKAYMNMEQGENLGWCRPYTNEDGTKAITVNEGEIAGIKGLADINEDTNPADALERHPELTETGCTSCPWKDECEAM